MGAADNSREIMSMRDETQKPERGVELLYAHLLALDAVPPIHRRRRAFERLANNLGPEFAFMLVNALAGAHGMRRRDLVA